MKEIIALRLSTWITCAALGVALVAGVDECVEATLRLA